MAQLDVKLSPAPHLFLSGGVYATPFPMSAVQGCPDRGFASSVVLQDCQLFSDAM